ncbi:eCIS core domain-containing protein [Laspinema olomoucense]|uniref:eCIS core domain-containing protein n=1 Tax=Laspinema olomoucense TaxID=3231600 RepID=UPI0021BB7D99|nr:DUF4157 domain-containing protein [Laspinema sp. D3a]MCT7992000.1 DUF4157 domain-containing protein [Laspinema sp. D3a]
MASGRKIQRNQPTATSAPQTRMFQPRPFAAPAQAEAASPQAAQIADVRAKLESQPTGDRLSRVDFSAPPPIQPKLTVGAAGDKYEQEADRVARQVVNCIQAPQVNFQSSESNPVQRKISIQAFGGEGGDVSSEWESELNRARGGGQPLSPSLREPMEREFGADFSGVRVHTGAQADRLARSIQAKAFTTGQDVFFQQGAYQPGSAGGQELLAHELTHVVQQSGSNVQRKEQQLITQQAESTSIQRALGKYNGSSIIEKGWVFYRKNPRITPLSLNGFNFGNPQTGSIVIMGTPSQVQSDINKVCGQDMLVSFAHEISGQFQGYKHNEEDAYYNGNKSFDFQLSASVDRVTLGGSGMQEILDVRGMVINQLTKDLVGFALGGFQEVYEPKIWTDIIQAGTDAYGVSQDLKEPKAYPEIKSQSQNGKVVEIVTISPVIMPGAESSIYISVDVDEVEEGARSVKIPNAKIRELLGGLSISGGSENIEIEGDEGAGINSIHGSIGAASRRKF